MKMSNKEAVEALNGAYTLLRKHWEALLHSLAEIEGRAGNQGVIGEWFANFHSTTDGLRAVKEMEKNIVKTSQEIDKALAPVKKEKRNYIEDVAEAYAIVAKYIVTN